MRDDADKSLLELAQPIPVDPIEDQKSPPFPVILYPELLIAPLTSNLNKEDGFVVLIPTEPELTL